MSTTKQSTHFTFPPEKESNKEFSLNCSGTVLETDHTMDHLRLQNISQVRQYNTYFNLSFSSDYWIQFCAEDAKKPQNFWTTSPLNLRRKKKRKLWFLVGNGHITLSKKKSNFQLYYRLWKATSAKCNYLNAIFDIISANYTESLLWHLYQGKNYPVVSVDPRGKWDSTNGCDSWAISCSKVADTLI